MLAIGKQSNEAVGESSQRVERGSSAGGVNASCEACGVEERLRLQSASTFRSSTMARRTASRPRGLRAAIAGGGKKTGECGKQALYYLLAGAAAWPGRMGLAGAPAVGSRVVVGGGSSSGRLWGSELHRGRYVHIRAGRSHAVLPPWRPHGYSGLTSTYLACYRPLKGAAELRRRPAGLTVSLNVQQTVRTRQRPTQELLGAPARDARLAQLRPAILAQLRCRRAR